MKNLILLLIVMSLVNLTLAQDKKSDNPKTSIANLACQCVDSIDVYNKAQDVVRSEITGCIDKYVIVYQLLSQTDGLDLNEDGKKKSKKSKTIQLSTNADSKQYKSSYQEIESQLFKDCESLKKKLAANDKQSDVSMSKNPEAVKWYERGNEDSEKGKIEGAIAKYKKALSIDSMFTFAWDNLGLAYRKSGEYQKALDAYQTSMAIDPNGIMPLQNIAVVYEYMKDYPQAIQAYEQLAKRMDNNPEVYYGMGRIYASFLREFEKGLENMCRAYRIYLEQKSPYRADAEQMIGFIYQEMKKQDREKQFKEILKKHKIEIN